MPPSQAGSDLSPVSAGLTLVRRRCGADEVHRILSERRDEAEPGKSAAALRPPERMALVGTDLRAPEPSPAAPLVPASAIERVAMEVGRMAGRPFVEMDFGRDLRIRITRSPGGVDLLLEARSGLRAAAMAQLPGLVAALRARGVEVAKAEVRPGELAAPGSGALTPRRGSATNAATSHPGGTVAKW